MGSLSQTQLSNFTFTFHFHALEKEMATHSSVFAWRIPGTAEPGGLPSMRLHRVGHNWRNLAAEQQQYLRCNIWVTRRLWKRDESVTYSAQSLPCSVVRIFTCLLLCNTIWTLLFKPGYLLESSGAFFFLIPIPRPPPNVLIYLVWRTSRDICSSSSGF